MASSIFSRKRDLIYLTFFIIHIPVMFLVDLNPLYPASIRPQLLTTIREWYINTYEDQFFVSPPAWFGLFIWMEALFHLPVSTWAIGALKRNDPKVPLVLLIYATQTAITTATCIADYMSWETVSVDVKMQLGALYVPYLALAVFMGVDMFGRLSARIEGKSERAGESIATVLAADPASVYKKQL